MNAPQAVSVLKSWLAAHQDRDKIRLETLGERESPVMPDDAEGLPAPWFVGRLGKSSDTGEPLKLFASMPALEVFARACGIDAEDLQPLPVKGVPSATHRLHLFGETYYLILEKERRTEVRYADENGDPIYQAAL